MCPNKEDLGFYRRKRSLYQLSIISNRLWFFQCDTEPCDSAQPNGSYVALADGEEAEVRGLCCVCYRNSVWDTFA